MIDAFAPSATGALPQHSRDMNLDNATIAVIGLGYVGLPLAVGLGQRRPVVGFDIKPDRIAELRAGRDSALEVEGGDLAKGRHLTFFDDTAALSECGIFIVTVPRP